MKEIIVGLIMIEMVIVIFIVIYVIERRRSRRLQKFVKELKLNGRMTVVVKGKEYKVISIEEFEFPGDIIIVAKDSLGNIKQIKLNKDVKIPGIRNFED